MRCRTPEPQETRLGGVQEPEEHVPGPDDTIAFQRFYNAGADRPRSTSLIYRLLIAWWRDRR